MPEQWKNCTDTQLASFLQNGYTDAFAELTARYLPLIQAKARPFCSALLETDDLCQEGLLGLFSAALSYAPQKNAAFKTYAGVCIQNRMVAAYRAGVRKKSVPVHRVVSLSDEQTEQLVLQSGNQAQNPEALLIDREDLQRIYQGIQQRLSRLEQQVFFLYLSGKKYGEIANTLSISPKSADNAVQRVRKKLQACSSICPGSLS